MSYSFTAAPQIVKGKTRYRPDDEETPAKSPWDLEQDYVKNEEDRIKIENMQRQQLNFKKSNKSNKMSPFDIKPTPNPRIPINLSFFLTDQNTVKPKLKNVIAQTDVFNNNKTIGVAAEVKYVPKKTGIDAFTQVENDELFNFDREVEPIINVIVSKTLEQGLLEIEEEEEIEKMRLFKRDYVRRKVKKNDDDWKEIIEVEMDKIDEKENNQVKLQYEQVKRENLSFKLLGHQMATSYLTNLLDDASTNLYLKGLYQNDEEHAALNTYWDWIIDLVVDELKEDYGIENGIKKIFPGTGDNLKSLRKGPDNNQTKKNNKILRIDEYNMKNEKNIWFYWENQIDNCPLYFTCFQEDILKNEIKTYDALMMEKIEEITGKFDQGQLSQEEFDQEIKAEMPNVGLDNFRMGMTGVNFLAFGYANDQYRKLLKADRVFNAGCLSINTKGELLHNTEITGERNVQDKSVRCREAVFFEKNLRNDEVIFKINQAKANENGVKYFYFYLWADDIDNKTPKMLENIEKTGYHIYDYKTNVDFHKTKNMSLVCDGLVNYQPEAKEVGEEEEQPPINNCIVGCYVIWKDNKGIWTLEALKAYAIITETKEEFSQRISKQIHTYNFFGDQMSAVEAWKKMIKQRIEDAENEIKRQEEAQRKKTMQEDEEEDNEEEKEKKEEEEKKEETKPEEPAVLTEKDHLTRLIGPLTVDLDTETPENLLERQATYIGANEPELNEYFVAGFELEVKRRSFEKISQLKHIWDWRQCRIIKNIPEPEVVEDENPDGEQEEEG